MAEVSVVFSDKAERAAPAAARNPTPMPSLTASQSGWCAPVGVGAVLGLLGWDSREAGKMVRATRRTVPCRAVRGGKAACRLGRTAGKDVKGGTASVLSSPAVTTASTPVFHTLFRTLAVLFAFAAAGAHPAYADVTRGEQLARQWCANCHVIGNGQTGGVPQGPPSFPMITRSGMTADQLRAFLSHPHGAMPDLALTRAEIDDLIGYIETLH